MEFLCHCNQNFEGFISKETETSIECEVLYTVELQSSIDTFLSHTLQTHQYANNKLKNGETEGLICLSLDMF